MVRTLILTLLLGTLAGCNFRMEMSNQNKVIPAKSMRITQQPPTTVVAGETLTPAIKVTYFDVDGAIDKEANQEISASLGTYPVGANLQNTLVEKPVTGETEFDDLNLKKSGPGYTITFKTESGLTATTDPFEVKPAPPSKIQLASGPAALNAGDCSLVPVNYSILDQYDNQSPLTQAKTINLGGNGLVFYSDVGCNTPITNLNLSAGQVSGSVYIIGNIAGAQTITFSGNGLTSGTQAIVIHPNAANKLAFTSAAQTLTAGTCSSAVTVQSQDLVGNPSNVETAKSISLLGSGFTFYEDSACSGASVTSVTIAQGTNSKVFYFKGTTSGSILLGATAVGFNSGSQTETINPAPATHLAFKVQPSHTVAGVAISPAIEVSLLDQFENIATSSSATITLNLANNPSGTATIVGGTKSKATTSGVAVFSGAHDIKIEKADIGYTLSASAPSLGSVDSNAFNILAAPAHHLTYLSNAQTLRAGQCSGAIQIGIFDAFNNPTKVLASTQLAFSGQDITIFSSATCTVGSEITSLSIPANGTSGLFYFHGTKVGSAIPLTVSATSGDVVDPAAQDQTILPGIPTQLSFISSAQTLEAGACSSISEIKIVDAWGNTVIPASDATVNLAGSDGATKFFTDASCTPANEITSTTITTAAPQQGSFYFTSTKSGSDTISLMSSVLDPNTLTYVVSGSQIQTINPSAPHHLSFSVDPTNVVAGQSFATAVAVTVEDQYSNTVTSYASPIVVDIKNNPPGDAVIVGGAKSQSPTSGVSTFTGASDLIIQKIGTGFTLKANSGTLPEVESSAFNVLPAAPEKYRVLAASQDLTAGYCSSASVQLQFEDAFGNISPLQANKTATFTSTPNTTGALQYYSDASCSTPISTTVSTGASTLSFYYKGKIAGTNSMAVSLPGLTCDAALGCTTTNTQSLTINPDLPYQLKWTSSPIVSPNEVEAGACSPARVLQSQDQYGNASVIVGVDQVVNLTPSSGSFYSDSTCTTPVVSSSILVGSSTTTLYFSTTNAAGGQFVGTAESTFTGSFAEGTASPNTSNVSQVSALKAAPPDHFQITQEPQETIAGQTIIGPFTAELRDRFENLASPSTAKTYLNIETFSTPTLPTLFGGAGMTSSATPTNPVGKTYFPDPSVPSLWTNAVGGQLIYTGTKAVNIQKVGTYTLRLSALGIDFKPTAQSVVFNVVNAPPSKLAFTTSAQTLVAGTCSGNVTIQSQDPYSNSANLSQVTTLTPSGTGMTFYSDASCATPIATIDIPNGANSATFYFKAITASPTQALTVQATAGATLTQTTQNQIINPDIPHHLAFTTAARTTTAGLCSSAITLQSQDQFNNPSPVSANENLSLSNLGTPGTADLSFFSNSTCTTSIGTTATIPSGSSAVTIYAKGTVTGTVDVTATPNFRPAGAVTQTETITPAPLGKIVYLQNEEQVLTAGDCSAEARIKLYDAFDNVVSGSPTTVSFASSDTGFTFYSDSTCTTTITNVVIPTNASEASFWFKSTVSGLDRKVITSVSSPSVTKTALQDINPAGFKKFAFTNGTSQISSLSITAGVCQALTVLAQDEFGNTVATDLASQRVVLMAPSTDTQFFTNTGCNPGDELALVNGGDGTYPNRPYLTITAAKQKTFYLKNTVKGSYNLSAEDTPITFNGTFTLTINADVPHHLAFDPAISTSTAGQPLAPTPTKVTILDQYNNITTSTASVTVAMDNTNANNTGVTLDGTLTANAVAGTASFPTINITKAGTNYTLKANSGVLPTAISNTFNVIASAPTSLAISSPSHNVPAGQCSPASTVTLTDTYGNPASYGSDLAIDLSGSGLTFYTTADCSGGSTNQVTVPTGQTSANFYYIPTTSGTISLNVVRNTAPVLTGSSQDQTITPAPASKIAFATSPRTDILAGACSGAAKVITVELQDTYNNRSTNSSGSAYTVNFADISATTAKIYSDDTCTTELQKNAGNYYTTIANGGSFFNLYILDNKAESVLLNLTIAENLWNAQQTETIIAAAPSKLAFISSPVTNLVAGTCSTAVSFQAQDAFDNPSTVTGDKSVTLSSDVSVEFFEDAGCSTPISGSTVVIANGTHSGSLYFRSTVAGNHDIQISTTGLTSATQTESVTFAAVTKLGFKVQPTNTVAGIAITPAIIVEAQDTYGNLVSNYSGTIDIVKDVTPAGGILSGTTSIATTNGSTSFNDLSIEKTGVGYSLIASSAGLTSVQSNAFNITSAAPASIYFVSDAQSLDVKNCSAVTTVGVKDSFNNITTVSSNITLDLSGDDITYYSDSSCSNVITQSTITAGQGQTQFWFKATKAGNKGTTASSVGLTPATQVQTIAPGLPSKIAITSAPQTIRSGECSGALDIESQDVDGNTSPAIGAIMISAIGSNYAFYSDSTCTTPATTITIGSGSSNTQLWFKGNLIGDSAIQLTAPGMSPSPSQTETIVPGYGAKLRFTSAGQNLLTNECSSLVNFRVYDVNDNETTLENPVDVDLTPTGGVLFYSDAGCTNLVTTTTVNPNTPSAGSSEGSFYFKTSTIVGQVDTKIEVYSTTSPDADRFKNSWSDDTLTHDVLPRPPTQISMLGNGQSVRVNSCSAVINLQTLDSFNNVSPVASTTTVNLSSSHTIQYFSDSNCLNALNPAAVSISGGTSTASFYIKSLVSDTITVTAATTLEGNNVSDSDPFVITPAAGATLVYTSTPSDTNPMLKAGQCVGVYNISLRDRYGNPTTADMDYPLVLSSINSTYYWDSNCTDEIVAIAPSRDRIITIPQGQSSLGPIYMKNYLSGPDNTIVSSFSGLENAIHDYIIDPGTPTKLGFSSNPRTVAAGVCSQEIIVTSLDTYDNESSAASDLSLTISLDNLSQQHMSNGDLTLYSDANCTTPVASPAILQNTSRYSFYLLSKKSGSVTTTVSTVGLTNTEQIHKVTPNSPYTFLYTQISSTIQKGTCSPPFSGHFVDTYGNATGSGPSLVRILTSGVSTILFKDAACSQTADSSIIPTSDGAATYYLNPADAGTLNLATDPFLLSSPPINNSVTVIDGNLDRVQFTSAPHRVGLFFCSPAVTIELQDSNNTPISVTNPAGLDVFLYGKKTVFYTSSDCSGATISKVNIPNGQSTVSFYYKINDSMPENQNTNFINLNIQEPGVIGSTQTYELLLLYNAKASIHADALNKGILQEACTFANASYSTSNFAYPLDITITPTANLEVYSDASCVNPIAGPRNVIVNNGSMPFYVKGTSPGSGSLTYTEPHLNPGSQSIYVKDRQLTIDKNTLPAGECTPYTFESRDYLGNLSPVTDQNLDIKFWVSVLSPYKVSVYSDASCTSEITRTSIDIGQSTKTIYVQSYMANEDPWSFYGETNNIRYFNLTSSILVQPQPASKLVISDYAYNSLPIGDCSKALSFISIDSHGNKVDMTSQTTVNLSAEMLDAYGQPAGPGSPYPGVQFFSDSQCTQQITSRSISVGNNTTQGFHFKSTTKGTFAVKGTAPFGQGYTLITSSDERLAFTVSPNSPNNQVYQCRPFTVQHQSIASGLPTNPDQPIELTVETESEDPTSSGPYILHRNSDCSDNGKSRITSVIQPLPGSPTQAEIEANVSKTYYILSYTLEQTPLRASAAGRVDALMLIESSLPPDAKLLFTENLPSVEAGVCSGSKEYTTYSVSSGQTTYHAKIEANLVTSDATGNKDIIGGSSTIFDLNSQTLTFYSDPSCLTQITQASIPRGKLRSPQFFFKSNKAGPNEMTGLGQLTGQMPGISGKSNKKIHASSVHQIGFGSEPQTIRAGDCSNDLILQVQDRYGNEQVDTVDNEVSFLYPSGFTLYSDSSCQNSIATTYIPANQSRKTIWFRHTTAGNAEVKPLPVRQLEAIPQTEKILSGTASFLRFTNSPISVPKGSCSAMATVQIQDLNGNAVPSASDMQVDLIGEAGSGLIFYSDSSCSIPSTINSVTIPNGQNSASFYFVAHRVGQNLITAKNPDMVDAKQYQNITQGLPVKLAFSTSPQEVFAGNCSYGASVKVLDSYNEQSAATANTTLSLTGDGFTFYSDRYCSSPIVSMALNTGDQSKTFYFKKTVSGSSTITVSDNALGTLSPAVQSVLIKPSSLSYAAFLTAPNSIKVGQCSPMTQVGVFDQYNNLVPLPLGNGVILTLSGASMQFFLDGTCQTPLAANQAYISQGESSTTFFFSSNTIGSRPINVANNRNLDPTSQVQTFVSGTPEQLGFETPQRTIGAGQCSQVITISTRDLADNETNAGMDYTISLSPPPGAQFYSSSNCSNGTEISTATIVKDTSRVSVYLKAQTTTGASSFSVSEASLSTANQNFDVSGGAPASLAFTSAIQSNIIVETCSAVVNFGFKDAYGNNTQASGPTTVSLSSPAASFYSDAACTSAITSVNVNSGQSSGSFYFKPTQVGSIDIQVSSTGLTSATQTNSATAGSANKLVFTSAPQTITAGTCKIATLQTQDNLNNPASSASSRNITLASSGSPATFYASADCTGGSTTSITLPANNTTIQFSYLITQSGSSNLTGTSSGLAQALQTQTIVADTAIKLAFTTSSRTITAGSCSANIVIQSQDTYSNASTVPSTKTVALSGSNLTFYSDSNCTSSISTVDIASGTHSATFYFKSTVAGTPSIDITTSGLTAASQSQTVNNDVPNQLVYLNAPLNLVAGSCGTLNMQLQDQYGNPAAVGSSKTITYQISGVSASIYSDSGCTNAITTQALNSGHSFTAYFKSAVSGLATVRISTPSINFADQTQTITAGANDHIAFTTSPLTVNVNQCSGEVGPITVQVQDSLGNASPLGTGASFTLSGSGITFYSDASCTTTTTALPVSAGSHTASFYFKTSNAGTKTVSVAMTGFTTINQDQTVNPLAATKLGMSSATQTIPTTVCSPVTVQTQDIYSNAIARAQNTTANLTVTSGTLSIFSDASCTVPTSSVTILSGNASAPTIYVKSNTSGTAVLTASDSEAILTDGSQTITLTAGTATKIAFTTSAQTITANACSAIVTVQAQDANSNPTNVAADRTVNLSAIPTATPASNGLRFYSNSSCSSEVTSVTINAGSQSASFYVKAIASNTYTMTAATTEFTSITQNTIVNPGSISTLVVTAGGSQPTLKAGFCSAAVTIQTRDAYGNAAPPAANMNFDLTGTNLSFFSNSGCSSSITQATITAGSSTTTFYYNGTILGSYTININGTVSTTASTTIIPGTPQVLSIISPITAIHTDTCSNALTVRSKDNYNNFSNVSGNQTITLSTTPSANQLYSDFGCVTPLTSGQVTIPDGTSTSNNFYFKHNTAETVSLNAHLAGFTDDNLNINVANTGPMIRLYEASNDTLYPSGSSYDYGVAIIDTPKSFYIKNDGSTVTGSLSLQLVIDTVNPGGTGSDTMWSLTSDQCSGNTLNPGATCIITIRFNAQSGTKPAGDYYYSNIRIQAAPKSDGDGTIDVQMMGIKQ